MPQSDVVASTAVRSPLCAHGLRRRLAEHVRVPLHRDGYALAVNSAFTAATGLLYWILAAKTYSTHAVGLNSALISSMMFLAGIASLNLPNILVRFLPESGDRTRTRVICAYGVAGAFALCVSAVFIIGIGAWAPRLSLLRSDHGLQAWFLCSTLAWCLFTIQDSVLTALGRAVWVPVENAVFSVLKLGLLAALAASVPLYGIFVSWTLAMLVSVIGVNAVIFTRLMRPVSGRASATLVSVRDRAFARYFTADYACSIASLSTANLMPVIVTAVAGATTNAYWAMAYAVTLPLYAFGQNIGTSLILHGSTDRAALTVLTRKAAIQGGRVLIPLAALLVVLAPFLLSLFGANYTANGATLLRLLALGSLPNFILSLAVSVARVQRRLRRALVALGAEAVIALATATPLLHALGVTGVGIAWVGAQCIVAIGLLLTWRTLFAAGTSEVPQARGAGSLAAGKLQTIEARPQYHESDQPSSGSTALHPVLCRLFAALERRRVCWTLLRVPSNPAAPLGDVDILVAPTDAAALRDAAAQLGFVAVPGWESPPDLILVCYDRPSDRWLLLDVSTAVSFRAPRSWLLARGAQEVLRRRRRLEGMVVPADGDAFWLLTLHCLLDKRRVASHHRAALRKLACRGLDSRLGGVVCAAAGARFEPGEFVDAARRGDWNALSDMGSRLIAELRRRRPVRERLRVVGARLARLARKPLLLPRRRGISLALLGPNGVGKSTAADALRLSFPFESRVVYMGIWKAADRGRGRAMTVAEILARPLQIWRRYLVAQYHLLRGRLVVFDRYVYEALLPPRPPLVAAKRAYFWLLAHSIPRARAAAVLDVPGSVAYGRKQENPAQELESERLVYSRLPARMPSIELVDAGVDAGTVRAEITTIVWRELAARWQRGRMG
jgi:O-antigen/teichoic acid export membrane protein